MAHILALEKIRGFKDSFNHRFAGLLLHDIQQSFSDATANFFQVPSRAHSPVGLSSNQIEPDATDEISVFVGETSGMFQVEPGSQLGEMVSRGEAPGRMVQRKQDGLEQLLHWGGELFPASFCEMDHAADQPRWL